MATGKAFRRCQFTWSLTSTRVIYGSVPSIWTIRFGGASGRNRDEAMSTEPENTSRLFSAVADFIRKVGHG